MNSVCCLRQQFIRRGVDPDKEKPNIVSSEAFEHQSNSELPIFRKTQRPLRNRCNLSIPFLEPTVHHHPQHYGLVLSSLQLWTNDGRPGYPLLLLWEEARYLLWRTCNTTKTSPLESSCRILTVVRIMLVSLSQSQKLYGIGPSD